MGLNCLAYSGAPYFVFPYFVNVPLILFDFRVLKLQNKVPRVGPIKISS